MTLYILCWSHTDWLKRVAARRYHQRGNMNIRFKQHLLLNQWTNIFFYWIQLKTMFLKLSAIDASACGVKLTLPIIRRHLLHRQQTTSKTFWQNEKLLMMSNSSFWHNVFNYSFITLKGICSIFSSSDFRRKKGDILLHFASLSSWSAASSASSQNFKLTW